MALAMEDQDGADRQRWLQERRSGLGGSDAAAILGLSPWGTPLTVWLDKRGESAPQPERDWQEWGNLLEELVARRYAMRTGRKLEDPARIFRHAEFPHVLGTPDRLVIGERLGLEVKTARSGEEWGPDGTDEIPIHYAAQVAHYMEVMDFPRWDVAALIAGSDFRIYTLQRDREFGAALVRKMDEWWTAHMVNGERPPMDGSDGTRRWLSSKFPENRTPLKRASAEAGAIAQELKQARFEASRWEEIKSAAENRLKLEIGEAEGLTGEGWRVSWKRSRGRRVTDHEAIASELLDRLSIEERVEVTARHTRDGAGSRRFLFTEAK